MLKELQRRGAVLTLALLTVAVCVFAFINFQKEQSFEQPTDGVWWEESGGGLTAQRVLPGSPGERAGIKTGDLLTAINGQPTPQVASAVQQMFATGTYRGATYSLERHSVRLDVQVILEPADRTENLGSRLIAMVYLCIGLYVLFRRWTAPRSMHFYLFCLASFVLYAFRYTGKLNDFDWIIYWCNTVALALQPALFLHFAATFPNENGRERVRRLWITLLYMPGVLLVAMHVIAIERWSATEVLHHRLDQISLGYLALYYVLAAIVLYVDSVRETSTLRRQQLKWLVRGTLLAVGPFTLFYVIPFLADWNTPLWLGRVAGLFLVFVPLTFSYAIVRYRLMDVDLIFKRGVTYTLATGALVGAYFAVVAMLAQTVHKGLPNFGGWGLVVTVLLTAQLFDPLKRYIQGYLDRLFDRKRYDYRKTLIEFGRGLSSETDVAAVLRAVVDQLAKTLLVSRVAVFLPQPKGSFELVESHGLPWEATSGSVDLSFLKGLTEEAGAGGHIFIENTQQKLRWPLVQQRAVSLLDLNYFIPCRVQQKTVAVLGLGRTTGGDFLTSEDVELLESLGNYVGIAIQNAQLYASLGEKIEEYERLKEFNENIVESVNVGILTLDLNDRVESWNSQMEVLYAKSRAEVMGKPLSELFPPDFMKDFDRIRDKPGVHNLYKFRLASMAGELRTVNMAIAPLLSREFQTVGRIILVDDITDRTQLEGQLAQAEKLSSIGLLAAGVAHEVNTPLAVISSYAQMLTKQAKGDEKMSGLLEKITQQTFRASEIANSLLNFSRTSAAEFKEIDIHDVIRETLVLVDHQFKKAQVEVIQKLDAEQPVIRGNHGKLQQVFLNLFLNAKDAMAGGGRLIVATESNGSVTVKVSDTGSGIPRELLERIYDPFFTTKSTPKDGQRRGTGLGLSVSYGIIQEHAGKIQVESEPGHGTTFEIQFPLVRKPVHA
jgi:two-component system, NtrC family, sensor kinase